MQATYPFRNNFSLKKINLVLQTLGRGMGQIMLQNSSVSGLLFLVGVCLTSLTMGFAMVLATHVGMVTAMVLKYDRQEIQQGLYGFSPALVGAALILFFQPTVQVWLAIVVGSIVASVLQHFFIKRNIPAFTFPFVLVTWVLVFFLSRYGNALPSMLLTASYDTTVGIGFIPRAYGQVIFQGSIAAGIVFFIGVSIGSRVAGFFGLLGGIVAAGIAFILKEDVATTQMGLFGFNAVLCAIVFSGKKMADIFWALSAVVLSTVISIVMIRYQLLQLTFPFVAASCLLVYLKRGYNRK